jgi:hypothetical protein
MDRLSQLLWFANLFAGAVLILRLWISRLYRSYPTLFAYYLIMEMGGLVLVRIQFHSNIYAHSYIAIQVVLHVLAVLVVLELYRCALSSHQGLASFGRASVSTVAVAVTVLAAVGTLLDRAIPSGQSVIVHWGVTVQRTLDLIIIVFLLLIALFITWFPVKMSRNTLISILAFTLYYFTIVASLLAANVLSRVHLAAVNNVLLSVSGMVMLLWGAALHPEAESGEVSAGHAWDPEALEDLNRQLGSINTALTRLGRH